MYSKQEASKIRQSFWTRFGQYMKPVPSASGEKVNWSNYKTGISHIYFRMRAGHKDAYIGIELTHPSDDTRKMQYAQLAAIKALLETHTSEAWIWEPETTDENGKPVSRVYAQLTGVSLFREEDWPAIISFLKPRILALDAFWDEVKFSFEQ